MTAAERIEAWVKARREDVLAREGENSLRVGPNKPMGSLRVFVPVDTVPELRAPGVAHLSFKTDTGVWVYAWHELTLGALLLESENARVLRRAHWPTRPSQFVRCVRSRSVAPLTPLFSLISDAHGDKTSPGRADVCPGISREVLVSAYEAAWGVPEEAAVHLRKTRAQRRS